MVRSASAPSIGTSSMRPLWSGLKLPDFAVASFGANTGLASSTTASTVVRSLTAITWAPWEYPATTTAASWHSNDARTGGSAETPVWTLSA